MRTPEEMAKDWQEFIPWFVNQLSDQEWFQQFAQAHTKDQLVAWEFARGELIGALLRPYHLTVRQQILEGFRNYYLHFVAECLLWRHKDPKVDLTQVLAQHPHFHLPIQGGNRRRSPQTQAKQLQAVQEFDDLLPVLQEKLKRRFRNKEVRALSVKNTLNTFFSSKQEWKKTDPSWKDLPVRDIALKVVGKRYGLAPRTLNDKLKVSRQRTNENTLALYSQLFPFVSLIPDYVQWEHIIQSLSALPKQRTKPLPSTLAKQAEELASTIANVVGFLPSILALSGHSRG